MGHWEKYTFADLAANARLNLKLANEHEENQYYYCMTAIMFAALTAEAFFNHIGRLKVKSWDKIELKLSPRDKLMVIADHVFLAVNFGHEPFQSFSQSIKFRNALAHGKTEKLAWQHPDEKPETDWEKTCTLTHAQRIVDQIHELCRYINKRSGDDIDPFIIHGAGATSG